MVPIEWPERVSSAVFGVANRSVTSRFPVAQANRYRVVESRPAGKGSVGKTLNISSGGVLFTTTKRLPHGHLVEMAIHWPARLGGNCPVQFVATGRVIRSETKHAAVRIERYEFRTRATSALVAPHHARLKPAGLWSCLLGRAMVRFPRRTSGLPPRNA